MPSTSISHQTRPYWYNIDPVRFKFKSCLNKKRVFIRYFIGPRELHSGSTFWILLAPDDLLWGPKQNSFAASTKCGHWRKKGYCERANPIVSILDVVNNPIRIFIVSLKYDHVRTLLPFGYFENIIPAKLQTRWYWSRCPSSLQCQNNFICIKSFKRIRRLLLGIEPATWPMYAGCFCQSFSTLFDIHII